jgi:hypothetical protein
MPHSRAARCRGYNVRRFGAGAAALAWLAAATAADPVASTERVADFEAGITYDNNLGNGHFRSDIRGDFFATAATSQGLFFPLGDSDGVTLTGDLRAQAFDRFDGMNNLSLGPTLGYRRKFGLGSTAPWVAVSASAARLDFQNSIRNGWQYDAALRAGRRIDQQWDVSAEFRYERRTADHDAPLVPGIPGDVFDIRGRSLALNADYAWTEKTLFSLSYGYRNGDVVSTTRPNFSIFRSSAAIAADPVFGDDAFAYRLYAATQLLALRASQALGSNSSLNLGLQRQLSRGDGGNNYAKNLVELTYLHSF